APAATPTPPATPPAASFLPPGAAAPPTPTQLTPPSAPAPAPRWSVTFDTGEVFVVDGLTLVGRNPEARPGESVKRLLALPSQDMSLSKTHAQFQVVPDGALVMMDRGSTNGSLLVRGGVTRELGSGKPATLRHGDLVRFGDREMRVALSAGAPS
ncbi:MAG: FHA domain-containing protein, partial [Nocardioides sp.]|nr:FHA domain-containing protein [Nocardioides sp.]